MKPEILGVKQINKTEHSNKGSQIQWWDIEYRLESEVKTFRSSFGLTAQGKFFFSSKQKDVDKVVMALVKHELFQRIRITIASDWLVLLVNELGEDAVKQAFEEAVVKTLLES